MDFSFEKTHSAYMLFYQRCEPGDNKPKVPLEQTVELSTELAEVRHFYNVQFFLRYELLLFVSSQEHVSICRHLT